MGIRTPDLLHAIQRQPVHPRLSLQVTVLPRPLRSARVRACCGTFLLYRSAPANTPDRRLTSQGDHDTTAPAPTATRSPAACGRR
jgi:hypothetical protein